MEAEGSKTKALGCPRQTEAGLNTGESRWGPRTLPDVAASRASPGQTRGGGVPGLTAGDEKPMAEDWGPTKTSKICPGPPKVPASGIGGPSQEARSEEAEARRRWQAGRSGSSQAAGAQLVRRVWGAGPAWGRHWEEAAL